MTLRNLVLVLGAAVALAACDDDEDGLGTGVGGTDSRVRVVHAVPDAPALNVLVDGSPIGPSDGVEYTESVSYTRVDAGDHTVRLNSTESGATVVEEQLSAVAGADYTVVAAGLTGNASVQALVASDTNTAPSSGQAKIRFIHASPTAGVVDVYVTEPGDPLSDADRLYASISYGTVAEYLTLPSGRYRISVTQAGATEAGIELSSVDIPSGRIRTFVAVGNGSITAPLGLVTLNDR